MNQIKQWIYRDDYEFENTHILIGRGGVASLHLASKFSVSHDDVYVLTTKTTEFNLMYIYNYIRSNIKLIEDSFKGSTIKHSSKTALSQLNIKIPKNKQLIQELEVTFQQIETIENEVKFAEEIYNNLIQELSQEAMPKQINSVNTIITENIIETQEVIEIIPKKIIKKVSKKTKKLIIEE